MNMLMGGTMIIWRSTLTLVFQTALFIYLGSSSKSAHVRARCGLTDSKRDAFLSPQARPNDFLPHHFVFAVDHGGKTDAEGAGESPDGTTGSTTSELILRSTRRFQ